MKPPRHQSIDADSLAYAETHGFLCARRCWSLPQAITYPAALLGLLACCWYWPQATWIHAGYVLSLIFMAVLGVRVAAIACSVLHDPSLRPDTAALAALTDDHLPTYTILVPLYREPEVVPGLLTALNALDYPVDRLQIQLLLEEDDVATRAVLAAVERPAHIEITVAPCGGPRTKPRACNAGLRRATGELLVIYDAEDRPEPDQLRKAAVAYLQVADEVVCLQCRLSHYNSRQSLIARWAALEYLFWFRCMLPGLELLGAPMPLGGTSNHFRTAFLRDIGGWDPFNVTEDADLGMRISQAGKQVRMLASTTWEEAVTTMGAFIRQRSRWVKGYWQTWLVHTRGLAPVAFGPWRFLLFALHFGGGILLQFLSPVLWVVVGLWFWFGWSVVDITSAWSVTAAVFSGLLLAANAVFVGLMVATCLVTGRGDLGLAALLSPLAWTLQSVATWLGLAEYLVRPFHWAKTTHGAAREDRGPGRLGRLLRPGLAVMLLAVGLVLGASALVQRLRRDITAQRPQHAVQLPLAFAGADQPGRSLWTFFRPGLETWQATGADGDPTYLRQVSFPGEVMVRSRGRQSLARCRGLAVDVYVPADAPEGIQLIWYLRDWDGLWHQHQSPQTLVPGTWTTVEADLRQRRGWRGQDHHRPFDEGVLHHVSETGFRLFGDRPWAGEIRLAHLRSVHLDDVEFAARQVPAITAFRLFANRVAVYDRYECAFDLSKAYANPFDPDQVAVTGIFTGPDGRVERVPGFWYQAFDRNLQDEREVLVPRGRPEWRIRHALRQPGAWQVQVEVVDAVGGTVTGPARQVIATPRAVRGYIDLAAKDHRYLQFENGEGYYPIGHNICQPVDLQQPYRYAFTVPPDQGSYTYERFFAGMAATGENWGRIWMTPWNLGLEGHPDWPWFHGAGQYNLANAWKLDLVLARAREHGIRLCLTTMHKSEYARGCWQTAAYNVALGGMLDDPRRFFSDPQARRAYRNRLRYLVARWGHDDQIVCWELFSEPHLMPGYTPSDAADWHREMATYMRSLDLDRHLIFTHVHNWEQGQELYTLDEIECVQGNGYIRPPNRTPDHVVNFRNFLAAVEHYGKPVFVAEYGGRSEQGGPNADYIEAQLHSGLWASLVLPFGGIACQWWWNFIDSGDRYFHYQALTAFAADLDRLAFDWRTVEPAVTLGGPGLRCVGMQAADRGFYWVHDLDIFERYADLPARPGAGLVIADLSPGEYRVEFWDCHNGGKISERSGRIVGTVNVALPDFRRDLAVKLIPVPGSE